MAISDLEKGSVEILKHIISVTAFEPTVLHILPGVKYYFYSQNLIPSFIQAEGRF